MAQSRDVTFFEICRLCLEDRGYCDIFDENEIIDDIYNCTGIKVSLLDNLPQKICEKCFIVVNKAKQLRVVATKNDAHLKSISFHADAQPSKETRDNTRVVIQTETPKDTDQTPEVIESFLRVRNDLFESSIPEDSVTPTESPTPDSSQDSLPVKKQIDRTLNEYKCEKCFKVCKSWKKFYLHKRFHVKKFPCPKSSCVKRFATKGDLEKHARIHTGERPFICDHCYKGFTQRITLRKHKEILHCDITTDTSAAEIS